MINLEMPTIDTMLSPREVLNRLYLRLRSAYGKVLSAQTGDINADRSILLDIEAIETLVQKLSFSFIKKLRDDANIDAGSFEKLQEIERMLNEIVDGKRISLRQDHFVYRTAKHLRGVVRGQANKTRHSGVKEYQKIQQQKKELHKKEESAKQKIGKK